MFEKTRIPLRTWLLAAWLMTTQKSGTSAKSLEQVLGLNSCRTAWRLLHKLRLATVRPEREPLTRAVEVDEVMPFVHRVASLLTRWCPGTYQGVMSANHVYWYLQEFTFRFNRWNASHHGLVFYKLLQYAVQEPTTTHQQLIEREPPSSRG